MKNKKLAGEFAIGVILLVAIIVGGIFWVQGKRQEAVENAEKQQVIVPVEQKSPTKPVENLDNAIQIKDDQQPSLTEKFEKDPCAGHLYAGEATLRGTYVLDSSYGDQKEWLFKVVKEDIAKLPIQTKFGDGRDVNELIKIADATPSLEAKLKKATEENPETITIKGYYLHCEGGPLVSIAPAKLALAKYLKK